MEAVEWKMCLREWIIIFLLYDMFIRMNSQKAGIISHHELITHPAANYFEETFKIPPSKKISFKYNITFTAEKCCPIIGFGLINSNWSGRAYYTQCSKVRFDYTALYSRWYIYTKNGFPHSGCQIVSNNYICIGTRTLVVTSPRVWAFGAGYECKKSNNLNLTIGYQLEYFTDYQGQCEPLHKEYCKNNFNYNYTLFPNVLGHTSQREANSMYVFALSVTSIFNCYQHAHLFACRTLFPECQANGNAIFPCAEMCSDFLDGCIKGIIEFDQPTLCGGLISLNDPYKCYYEPIRCPALQAPKFGTLVTSGHMLFNASMYSCNNGYILVGDAIRHCNHSGLWNGSAPICKALELSTKSPIRGLPVESPYNLSLIIPSVVCSIIIIVIIGLVSVCTRQNKKCNCFNKRRDLQTPDKEKKKLFISYSSEDRDDVTNSFLPEVSQRLPEWKPLTYQEDFPAGEGILECIKQALWPNPGMLVLLTENYITSPYCRFELREAESRLVVDKDFCLVVILFVRNDNQNIHSELINNLPEDLGSFIRNRVYLDIREQMFWSKLQRSLEKNA